MKQKCMLLLSAKERKCLSSDAFSLLLNVIAHDVQSVGFDNVATAVSKNRDVDFPLAIAVNELINEIAKAYPFLSLNALFVVDPEKRACSAELDGKKPDPAQINVANMKITVRPTDNGLRIYAEACDD